MLYRLVLSHKKLLILATLLSVVSALSGIGIISLVNAEIENVSNPDSDVLRGLAIFFAALTGFLTFSVISQYILTKLSVQIMVSIRENLVQRVLSTSYEQIERVGGHRIFATLTKDIESLTATLSAVPHVAYNLATVLLCFAYMAYQSWQLFLFVGGVLLLAMVVAQLLMGLGIQRFQAVRELDDSLFKNFRALIDGGKELNINFNRKRFFYKEVVTPNIQDIKKSTISAHIVFIILSNWTNLILFLALGSVVFMSQLFLSGIATAVVVSFVLTLVYVIGPLTVLINTYSVVAEGIVSSQKIEKLQLSEEILTDQLDNTLNPEHNWQTLDIEAIEYEYRRDDSDDYHFSIGPVSTQIQRGEIVFLIGGNGCGKSTFAKVLCGLYTPTQGRIRLDGRDAAQAMDWYRCHFSTIFSDFYLFEQVIDANGMLADDNKIRQYLSKLKLDQKVTVDKGILSTTELSQGQKKRLGLLLSYMEDTPLYIFDEWAADQDPYFRNFFYRELLPELKSLGKTVFVISHDEHYFSLSDRILKFEAGQMEDVTASFPATQPVDKHQPVALA
ncbi:cyclic peptide export ABC transporter [Pseudoalteromonas sp. DL2-H2.2]|uniref:cyclic peptide export ABC transporter n=1 Tax=Pseudoalteromonas sp. DL2-H2.2 TaxID=2908889 RepID=UPI001F431C27|nr:cyclic peptide export ABC transporter [Pseudoalteromonas sp. DL2-H2.2]MCF2907159.1 cyclic peptide export ABC transporter [Pseudoalteromonas sp. DL2-H2.2]